MFIFDLQLFAEQAPTQGFDVMIDVMGPSGPALVGQYQEANWKIQDEDEEYWLTGYRNPMLLDGDLKITGSLKRGWVSMNLIHQIYGTGNLRRDQYSLIGIRFTISMKVDNPYKGLLGKIRLEACKFTEISMAIKAGKGVISKDLNFKAEGIVEL